MVWLILGLIVTVVILIPWTSTWFVKGRNIGTYRTYQYEFIINKPYFDDNEVRNKVKWLNQCSEWFSEYCLKSDDKSLLGYQPFAFKTSKHSDNKFERIITNVFANNYLEVKAKFEFYWKQNS